MFGNKRIKQLEEENARLRSNLLNESAQHRTEESALRNQVEYLIRTIRSIDDKIFSMGQMTSWEGMRPRFLELHSEMNIRKVAESNRIGALIEGELRDTYKPEMKRIGK
jgi:hypothetical protein